jgi:crotonobetainyl-CoA:carnitine CoA-transferase CaiB-like acyl-CoA transferase
MRPLDGVKVVAVEQAVAAPFATRHLADLGAEVIKIERRDGGDFARHYDSSIGGVLATHFAWLNRGKRSVALDLASEPGAEVLARLLDTADVFLHNLAPGAMARLGFDASTVRERRPRLIVAELTGYGDGGPMRDSKAYDLLVQAEAGVVSITGTPDEPVKCGIPIADIAAGTYLVQGVMAALLARSQSGEGDHIRVSLFDAMVEWMGYPLYRQRYLGSPPPRVGLAHPTVCPYDRYPTADGQQVLIGVQNDRGWTALVTEVLQDPDLITDSRTATNVARCDNREFVDNLVAERTRTMTADELTRRLEKAGIANGRVNGLQAVLEHPQLVERDRWTTVDSPAGPIEASYPPVISERFTPRMDAIPELGADTDAVLAELGYDTGARGQLREAGVVA